MKFVILFAIGCIAITEGCKQGSHDTKKRQIGSPTADEVDAKLASFFEKCLSGPASGIFDSLRSVVDTVIRDSTWYRDVEDDVCDKDRDVAECWIFTLPFLLDIHSPLYEPTAQCICDWAETCWEPPSGIRKREATYDFKNQQSYRPPSYTPGLSRELKQFAACTDKNVKSHIFQYPSLKKFDGKSNVIFFRDHYTFCREIPDFPYEQRNLFVLLYIERVCPRKGREAAWRKDVINVYSEATRKYGPLSAVVDTCDPNSKPDPCIPNPCRNGHCRTKGNSYECKCDYGYTGKHCENGPCQPNPCKNRGICKERNGRYYCQCQAGYSGKKCEIEPYYQFGPCVDEKEYCQPQSRKYICNSQLANNCRKLCLLC